MRSLSRIAVVLALWAVSATIYSELRTPAQAPAGIIAELQRKKAERRRKLVVRALVVAAACMLLSYLIAQFKKMGNSSTVVRDSQTLGPIGERLPIATDATSSGPQNFRPYQESSRF